MRHFKLVNSAGEELDITTKEVFFHEPSGLGFEEDNDFRQIGDFWLLNRTKRNQGTISGRIIFTESPMTVGRKDLTDPYAKYLYFSLFVSKTPLTMKYNPYGPIEEPEEDGEEQYYRRTVRVRMLSKGEKDTYGVINSDVEFACYTPWYMARYSDIQQQQSDDSIVGWIWSDDAHTAPLIFEPSAAQLANGAHRTQFGSEPSTSFIIPVEDVPMDCPIKLTIYGPLADPSWSHSLITRDANGVATETQISSGGFSSSVTLANGDRLVIDGTKGSYSIYQLNANGSKLDLYAKRNFGLPCFISFKEGENRLTITGSGGGYTPRIEIERHEYYATV